MEFEMTSDEFWDNKELIDFHHNAIGSQSWSLRDKKIKKIHKELGIEFINFDFRKNSNHVGSSTFYKFKILNKEKFLWAKIKYDI